MDTKIFAPAIIAVFFGGVVFVLMSQVDTSAWGTTLRALWNLVPVVIGLAIAFKFMRDSKI